MVQGYVAQLTAELNINLPAAMYILLHCNNTCHMPALELGWACLSWYLILAAECHLVSPDGVHRPELSRSIRDCLADVPAGTFIRRIHA